MKINLRKIRIKKNLRFLPLLFIFLMLAQCVDIDGDVEQPTTMTAGDTLTSVIHVSIPAREGATGTRLVVGFLAPREWRAASNTEISYKITSSNVALPHTGGKMSLVPAGTLAPGSILDWPNKIANVLQAGTYGANKIKSLDWIVFWSDETYNVANGNKITVDITLKVLTGERNVNVDLGYFVASSTRAMDPAASNKAFDYRFNRLETTGGKEPMVDYLEPQVAIRDPLTGSDNDYLTITLDGTVIESNPLAGLDQVYLNATAYTNDGHEITVSGDKEENKMRNESTDRWSLTIWPRGYFNISDNQTIDSIKYYFSDASGGAIVQQEKTNAPFLHVFSCE